MIDALVQRLLLLQGPEEAHHTALRALQAAAAVPGGLAALRALYAAPNARPVDLFGLRFPNRVGLAAGYDKDATAWRALAALGFGHVEIGTVTPQPQPGNPAPRVFRLSVDRGVINRMGFPSAGAAAVRARLSAERPFGVVLGVNLGKNKDTPNEAAAADYVAGVRAFEDVADYLVVNVSSPNTPGLRALQTRDALEALLRAVVDARTRPVPVLVKLAPDLDEAGVDDAAAALLAAGVDGVIATNTTLSRPGLRDPAAGEAGGLSGAPLTALALAFLAGLRRRLPAGFPVVAVGGILTPDDAARRLDAGADLVQLYTGLVYGGAGLAGQVASALSARGG